MNATEQTTLLTNIGKYNSEFLIYLQRLVQHLMYKAIGFFMHKVLLKKQFVHLYKSSLHSCEFRNFHLIAQVA
jgi:hypothetical protein